MTNKGITRRGFCYALIDWVYEVVKVAVTSVKALGLVVVGIVGLIILGFGVLSLAEGPPPEPTRTYFDTILWNDGTKTRITITLSPSETFVIGDHIEVIAEVSLPEYLRNGTASAHLKFPSSILLQSENEQGDYWEMDGKLALDIDTDPSSDYYGDCRGNSTLYYTREGFFSTDLVVMRRTQVLYNSTFFNVIEIRPYSYLEQRRNAHIVASFSKVVLGVSTISTIPAFDRLIEALDKFYASRKKENPEA